MGKKKAVKPKKEVPEAFGVDSFEDLSECGVDGVIFAGDSCPICALGELKVKANPGPAPVEPAKETEVDLANMVSCQTCGTIFDREIKGVDEGGLLAEAGLHCPTCSGLVEDGDGKPVKGNPDGEDSDFGDEVSWG